MKRLCFPLRGDHNLLTPDTHSGSVGGASLPGHLSNPSTRWRRSASPTRRLRFEDETETEAECRYLERQHGTGVQVSKPDLNQLNVRGRPAMTVAMSGAQLDCHLTLRPPVAKVRGRCLNRPLLQVRTEVLKDSYIGCVSPPDSGEGGGVALSRVDKTGTNQVTDSQAPPTVETPANPYALYPVGTPLPQPPTCPHHDHKHPSPLTSLAVTSLMMSQNGGLHNTMMGNQQEKKKSSDPQPGSELKKKEDWSSSAEDKAPPTSGSPDGDRRHPIREELHSVVSRPGRFSRDGLSRLSLHRFFSSVKLSKTRTASLDRLVPPVPDRLPSDGRNSCSLWKKSPSAQSLCGALGLQMKKSSSVQSFGSEEIKSCSVDHRPADEHFESAQLSELSKVLTSSKPSTCILDPAAPPAVANGAAAAGVCHVVVDHQIDSRCVSLGKTLHPPGLLP
ncbi:PREDICTED: uncharacterized protein LOC106908745 isoform X1 [Poecilia mexicana]|uniref:uncharacterized protein LOC106908745 isoform X1 n=1 Tax=Poecilia mexicana TaxID=48701 RepID=UPI00072DBC63|nr:PREDICTED: uncharacterized protein LOC106908745 isoform X1 [Poecilia mexicana]